MTWYQQLWLFVILGWLSYNQGRIIGQLNRIERNFIEKEIEKLRVIK